jgi:hypothetical protein
LLVLQAGAWTHFVKATFRKHSPGDKKKAPSASLARSIFVTWLNGVPYDTRDSPFLQEMKLTAAEYQTHSLAIANNHYDKDAASEAKLRVLVDFCDAYAQWQPDEKAAAAAGGAAAGKDAAMMSENVDSDDEESKDDAKHRSPSSSVADVAAAAVLGDKTGGGMADMQLGNDDSADDHVVPSDTAPAAVSASSGVGSGASSGAGSAAASNSQRASPLYAASVSAAAETKRSRTAKAMACAALQRAGAGAAAAAAADSSEHKAAGKSPQKTRASRKARKARDFSDDDDSGSDSASSSSSSSEDDSEDDEADETEYLPDRIVAKKTVRWQHYYLVHWKGYSAAERTWEPAAFFDEYCTKQTYEYEQALRPVRILAQHSRRNGNGSSSETKHRGGSESSSLTLFYEVQWHGHSETTMEVAEEMAEKYPDMVKDWEKREEQRQAQVGGVVGVWRCRSVSCTSRR